MSHVRIGRMAMIIAALAGAATPAAGQRRRPDYSQYFGNSGDYYVPPDWRGNPFYDGHVTFVRIKYRGYEHFTDQGPGWAHDYPRAESHFDRIMRDISSMRIFVEAPPIYGSTILALDDPLIMKYPVAYLSEPGGWHMTPAETEGLRKYISKGGFIVFDDMGCCGNQFVDLPNLVYEWNKAFPKAKLMQLPETHPIFDSFFKIDFDRVVPYYYRGSRAQIFAFFEDNDPKKRVLALINNMQDIGDWMEWSDRGFDVTPSNEAYKLAVNYYVYALTH
ncbi:MAG TPA: DUF4159 domain-containing protein [Gemmatimonadaceae bacterium]